MAKTPKKPLQPETRLITAGRDPQSQFGFVNPPVYHASTVLYPTAEDQVAQDGGRMLSDNDEISAAALLLGKNLLRSVPEAER